MLSHCGECPQPPVKIWWPFKSLNFKTMETIYNITAKSIRGNLVDVKPCQTLNYETAIRKGEELISNPNIKRAYITTVKGEVIRTFVNHKYLNQLL